MTTIKVAWLDCDLCYEASGDGSLGQSVTVAEARHEAKLAGWKRTRDGRDICPTCQNEGVR